MTGNAVATGRAVGSRLVTIQASLQCDPLFNFFIIFATQGGAQCTPFRRSETKMEALVAIKWVKEREGQVCEKATEDSQNLFCLIAIRLVSLF